MYINPFFSSYELYIPAYILLKNISSLKLLPLTKKACLSSSLEPRILFCNVAGLIATARVVCLLVALTTLQNSKVMNE